MIAFGVSQIVIDCETAYNIVHGRWPLHRDLHTLPGATMVGIASGIVVVLVRRALGKQADATIAGVPGELGFAPCLVGGLFGGVSHSILDAIMHTDVEPFAPMTNGNPLHGAVSLLVLHLFCVLTGVAGALWLRGARSGVQGHRTE
jgi:hypothetical protein